MKLDEAIDALDRERAANWFRLLAALLDPAFLTPEWRAKLKNADVNRLHLAARYCRLIVFIVAVTRTRLLKHNDFLGMAGFDKMCHSVVTVPGSAIDRVKATGEFELSAMTFDAQGVARKARSRRRIFRGCRRDLERHGRENVADLQECFLGGARPSRMLQ